VAVLHSTTTPHFNLWVGTKCDYMIALNAFQQIAIVCADMIYSLRNYPSKKILTEVLVGRRSSQHTSLPSHSDRFLDQQGTCQLWQNY